MGPTIKLTSIVRAHGAADLRPVEGFGDKQFFAVPTSGRQAYAVWQSLRDAAAETGYWPVIAAETVPTDFETTIAGFAGTIDGIHEMSDAQLEFLQLRRTAEELLKAAEQVPFERWVEQRLDPEFHVQEHLRKARFFDGIPNAGAMADHHRAAAESYRELRRSEFNPHDCVMPPVKNRNPPQHELFSVKCIDRESSRRKIADTVTMLLVPARHGWEVPAHLFYSTREGDLPPQAHVAALKWLFDRFGAELVGFDSRTLEVIPRTRPSGVAALRAAFYLGEYSHCPATSENEAASTAELAVYLAQSTYWTFCWP
jgi:hypothetical protein